MSTLDCCIMAKPELKTIVAGYVKGTTYEVWTRHDGVSDGNLNALTKGKTTRPHPDTLLAFARAFAAEGRGNVKYIYFQLMEAAGYLDMLPSSSEDITLEEWREFKKVAPESAVHFLEDRLGQNWSEIVKDVEEMRTALDSMGDGGQEPVNHREDV